MPSKIKRYRETHTVWRAIACTGRVDLGRSREPVRFAVSRRGQMFEVAVQVEAVEVPCEEEADIVELSLVDLYCVAGGAGNAAMSF